MSVCPACDRSSEVTLHSRVKNPRSAGGIFSIVRCAECDFLFTQNPPNEKEIGRYYDMPDYMPHQNDLPFAFTIIRWFRNAGKCAYLGTASGRLIDIGCGTGGFLQVAKSRGWNVLGVEPDEKARTICEAAGVETMSPSAITMIADASADAITLWHALEHIHDFRETLRQCKRILKANGILVIGVPNIASPEAAWYGEGWAGLDVPIHLHHFTPDTMRTALQNEGFDLTATRATWTDAIICCILSERFSKGYFLRGVARGIRSTLIGWSNPEKAGCPVYRAAPLN